jgi:putative salt-induced outer membrane protein YdiY
MNIKTTIVMAAGWALAASAIAQDTTATAEAKEEKKPRWESSAGVGLTLTRGNSETLLATANVITGKKWEKNEIALGANAAYGEDDGEKNTESFNAFGQYNRLFSERLYGYGRVDGLYDGMAYIDYRVMVSAGLGYYFIKNDKMTLSAEVGPGWVAEKVGGVDALGNELAGETDEYFTIRFAERFEYKITKNARIWQLAEYLPQIDDWGNYVINAELGIESSISKSVNLRAYLQDTYRSEPATGAEENDLKLVAGIQYKF